MRRRTVLLQVLQTLPRLADGWNVSHWNPPQHEDRALDRLEPLLAVAQWPDVRASIDELLQRGKRLPHGHVDGHALVVVRADRGGIAVFRLQAPDESGTLVGQRIDRVQLRAESLH